MSEAENEVLKEVSRKLELWFINSHIINKKEPYGLAALDWIMKQPRGSRLPRMRNKIKKYVMNNIIIIDYREKGKPSYMKIKNLALKHCSLHTLTVPAPIDKISFNVNFDTQGNIEFDSIEENKSAE